MGDLPALIADHDVLSRCCKYGGVHNGAVWPPGPTGLRCAVVAYEEAAHAEACIAGWRVIRLLPRGNPSLPSITTTPTPEFRRRLQSLSGPGGVRYHAFWSTNPHSGSEGGGSFNLSEVCPRGSHKCLSMHPQQLSPTNAPLSLHPHTAGCPHTNATHECKLMFRGSLVVVVSVRRPSRLAARADVKRLSPLCDLHLSGRVVWDRVSDSAAYACRLCTRQRVRHCAVVPREAAVADAGGRPGGKVRTRTKARTCAAGLVLLRRRGLLAAARMASRPARRVESRHLAARLLGTA